MEPFVHLLAPDQYLPGLWDFRCDPAARATWRRRLLANIEDMVGVVRAGGDPRAIAGAERARVRWSDVLRRLDDAEVNRRYPTVHDLVRLRDRWFREEGVPDVYDRVKREENARSLVVYGATVADLDAGAGPGKDGSTFDPERMERALWLVLAGNVFDMAAPRVAEAYAAGSLKVSDLTDEVRSRRPVVDGREAFTAAVDTLRTAVRPQALVFVDNAGMDFILGIVPLARELCRVGFEVRLAANEFPSLNDITASEAPDVLAALRAQDPLLDRFLVEGRLGILSSGNEGSGIDLREVAPGLNEAAEAADLLIFEGQGRAVETGWLAELARPTLRLATVKSPIVAGRLGVRELDPIIDFRDAGAPPPIPVDRDPATD